jgi:hypothetical protein
VNELASHDVVVAIQEAVDKIVAAAKARSVN